MVATTLFRVANKISRTVSLSQCCRQSLYSTSTKDRFYTKKHEWVSVNNNVGTVGVSSFAQEALGEVVFAQLPDVGKEVKAGDECGALESVKAASEVYTPVAGTITEKNDAVESSPSLINKSCYGEGWLFKLKLSSPDDLRALMDQTAYEKYLEECH